jgi:hypothetical protein
MNKVVVEAMDCLLIEQFQQEQLPKYIVNVNKTYHFGYLWLEQMVARAN